MRNRITGLLIAAVFLAFAGSLLAQNADQNTGGPTKNTLRLRLTEPVEGATITGSSVRVSVDWNQKGFGQGQGTKFGEANFPQPRFDIFLDSTLKETLKGTEKNVTTVENVSPGSHKIVVLAKNVSGEVIDRKEVGFTTVAAESATTTMTTAQASERIERARRAACGRFAPAPEARTYEAPPPAPQERVLPKTASEAPLFAFAGLGLIGAGLLIGRKGR